MVANTMCTMYNAHVRNTRSVIKRIHMIHFNLINHFANAIDGDCGIDTDNFEGFVNLTHFPTALISLVEGESSFDIFCCQGVENTRAHNKANSQ